MQRRPTEMDVRTSRLQLLNKPHPQALPAASSRASPSACSRWPRRRAERGFTLVELITVILILGVLAAVALPRFANLQGKAREAKVKGMAGAMNAAASLTKASAMAAQVSCGSATGTSVSMESMVVDLNHCYPQALGNFGQGILGAANIRAADDWVVGSNAGAAAAGSVLTIQLTDAATPANCSITYTSPATAAGAGNVAVTVSGC